MNRNKKMKKEKLQVIESQSYIYPITEDIIKKFKDHSLKLISDDKKYLLVYTQINLNELIDYYEWLFEQELFAKSSPSDMEYETLLEEFDIKKPFNHKLYASSANKFDEKTEKLIYFNDSKRKSADSFPSALSNVLLSPFQGYHNVIGVCIPTGSQFVVFCHLLGCHLATQDAVDFCANVDEHFRFPSVSVIL
jgi:hypothetical protein